MIKLTDLINEASTEGLGGHLLANNVFDIQALSNEYKEKYGKQFEDRISKLILGKKIQFRGMSWEKNGHTWEDTVQVVKRIRPSRSGNPFDPEITIEAKNGVLWTVNSNYGVKIVE